MILMYNVNIPTEPRSLQMIKTRKDPLLGLSKLEVKMTVVSGRSAPLDSRTLFAGGSELVIAHGVDQYRLRLTRQNKLILTK